MNYLMPFRFKKAGLLSLCLGLILGLIYLFFEKEPDILNISVLSMIDQPIVGDVGYFKLVANNIFDELILLFLIFGGGLIAFSKEKVEDELIAKIRLESLVWAVYANYLILIFAIIFIYGLPFLWVMVFNIFTTLIIFLLKFNLALIKLRKSQES